MAPALYTICQAFRAWKMQICLQGGGTTGTNPPPWVLVANSGMPLRAKRANACAARVGGDIIPSKRPNREGLKFMEERRADTIGRVPRNPWGPSYKPCSMCSIQLFKTSFRLEREQYYRQLVPHQDLLCPYYAEGGSLEGPWWSLEVLSNSVVRRWGSSRSNTTSNWSHTGISHFLPILRSVPRGSLGVPGGPWSCVNDTNLVQSVQFNCSTMPGGPWRLHGRFPEGSPGDP